MVCECFVVACLNWMPSTGVVSFITSNVIWVRLSVMMVVWRYADLVRVSNSTRAIVLASILVTQYMNKYRETSPMAVTMAVYQFDGSLNGKMSICKASSGPNASLAN